MPLGTARTAPLLTRTDRSRPHMILSGTRNIACVEQFVEIPDDTALTMEYSVLGAQIAVAELMALLEKPHTVKKSLLLEVLHWMVRIAWCADLAEYGSETLKYPVL